MSAVLPKGRLVEMVFDPVEQRTRFVLWQNGAWRFEPVVRAPAGERLIPYSAHNNLIKKEVVLFPSEPCEYGSEADLVGEIQSFIHRYVDVSPRFERIASYYVLFSWLYDGFAELPYLRLRGDYGSGKTRFLLTVGSLCYKPIFASGATSTSAIFRMLDCFGGTLIIDEGDFRYSDEKSDLIKIFNNGNQKGLPVIKTEMSGTREFNPRAFEVFSPKILASRGSFDDKALESRFLTEESGGRKLRRDIPINLPPIYKDEARALRNKLLFYRFRNHGKNHAPTLVLDERIEPRLRQIFIPLMSIVSDDTVREELRDVLWRYHQDLRADRSMDVEAQTLDVIRELLAASSRPTVSIKEVTDRFTHRHGRDYERITPKWIGTIIRKRLHLRTHKSSHGVFVISPEELKKLPVLYEKYGVMPVDAEGSILPDPGDSYGTQARTRGVDDPASPVEDAEVAFIRFLLFTALRRNEAANLQWADIRDDCVHVAAERNKSKRDFMIPLSSSARAALAALPSGLWVFPADSASGHIEDPRKALKRTGYGISCHDLRRTWGSAAAFVMSDAIRRRLLNHAPADVTERHYTVLKDAELLREYSEKVDRLLLGKVDLQSFDLS